MRLGAAGARRGTGRWLSLFVASFGGSTVLVATSTGFADRLARSEYGGFDAGIAVYPGCGPFAANGPAAEGVKVPLLLLLGGADDWAPPDACVKGAAARQSAGDSIDVRSILVCTTSLTSRRPAVPRRLERPLFTSDTTRPHRRTRMRRSASS